MDRRVEGLCHILSDYRTYSDFSILPQFQLFHTVIYSFHMPLFMFLSGIFSYKALEAVDNQCKKVFGKENIAVIGSLHFWGGYCFVFIIMKISSVNFYLKVVPTTGIY